MSSRDRTIGELRAQVVEYPHEDREVSTQVHVQLLEQDEYTTSEVVIDYD